jgi:hypothetical protein
MRHLLKSLAGSQTDFRARFEGILTAVGRLSLKEFDYAPFELCRCRGGSRISGSPPRRSRSTGPRLPPHSASQYLEHLNLGVGRSGFDDRDKAEALQEDRQGLGVSRKQPSRKLQVVPRDNVPVP